MPSTIDKSALESKLRPAGQLHLLRFWDKLSPAEQSVFAAEIMAVDFDLVARLVGDRQAGEDWSELARRAESPPAIRLNGVGGTHSAAAARTRGEAALRAGELAVVLVAGGQGTRLGFDHPKGMYPIGPVSQHSLFQILCEKVLATTRRYGRPIPLCIMTSPATHQETVDYLQAQRQFGLPAGDVTVFCQGTMPAVDLQTGKLLLAERGRLALSPDGHGGMLAAMKAGGILQELTRRGVRQLFYMQVDNPLVVVCDPLFVGHHLLAGSEMSTQVVAKRDPLDRVGNFVSVAGQARIIEYSDLPEEAARRKNRDGSLALWAGNIAVHVLDVQFLERMAAATDSLPFHRARKKAPCLNEQGELIEPQVENALKFERFIFDLLPAAKNAIAVEVDEGECFAPLKNGPGAAKDSPEIVRRRMVELHRGWLERAGAEVAAEATVEISPLFALDAEELSQQLSPGVTVPGGTFLQPEASGVVTQSSIPGLPVRHGKVRDVYDLGDQLLLVSTDRISAFDWILPTGIPDKGRVLTQLSAFWFQFLGEPHHMLSTDVESFDLPPRTYRRQLAGRSMLCRKTQVVPIECVVRGYLSGSGWKEYRERGEVCGVKLPAGLRESDRLPTPIFTPATKEETGHDINISFEEMARLVGRELAEELRRRSIGVYERGAAHAASRGIIIADTKFEWGQRDGQVILIDEALTPDSSRFWPADRYQPGGAPPSFDKQFVRDWLSGSGWDKNSPPPPLPADVVSGTRARYIEAFETLSGKKFI